MLAVSHDALGHILWRLQDFGSRNAENFDPLFSQPRIAGGIAFGPIPMSWT